MASSKFLDSLSHAASGSAGAALSTAATYPLDLVNTRLKVQRQLAADGSLNAADAYTGVSDAFARIWSREGGWRAFFIGLGPDAAKSAADSFLFFLFYSWFRARRLALREAGAARYLGVFEELAVGAAAGACARAFTTPIGNAVTRRQTASLVATGTEGEPHGLAPRPEAATFWETVGEIRREKGMLGLWAGYSASLVLTLNPSITFFLQQALKKSLVPHEDWDNTAVRTTFLLAALSKVIATTITYPFQIAKARIVVSAPTDKDGDVNTLEEKKREGFNLKDDMRTPRLTSPNPAARKLRNLAGETIFGTVYRIASTEGVAALYDGLCGELIKAFFNHGLTMLSKDMAHKLLVRLYYAVLAAIRKNPAARARLIQITRNVTGRLRQAYPQTYISPRAESNKRGVNSNGPEYAIVSNIPNGNRRKIAQR